MTGRVVALLRRGSAGLLIFWRIFLLCLCYDLTKVKRKAVDKHTNKHSSDSTVSVESGGFRGKHKRKRLLLIAGTILLAVALLFGTWQFVVKRSLNPGVNDGTSFDPESLSDNYLIMDSARIEYVFHQKTGMDIRKVQRDSLTRSDFKEFSHAYEAGRALNGLGDRAKAFEAYTVAETMIDTKDIDAVEPFYLDYSRVALELGKNDDVKRIADKAIDLINSSNRPDGEKKVLKEHLEDMKWLAQQ